MARPYTRSIIPVVDKRFQYKYTAILIAIVVIFSAVLGYLLLESYWEMNRIMNLAMEIPEIRRTFTEADQGLNVFHMAAAFVAIEGVLIGVLGLLITHRICGPLFVIEGHLLTLLRGNYPRMRPLRAGDEFVSTYETLKDVVESLKKRDEDEAKTLTRTITGMPKSDIILLQRLVDDRKPVSTVLRPSLAKRSAYVHRECGFTLTELIIALAIVSILSATALPLLTTMVATRQVKTAQFDFYVALTYARSEAVKRNSVVTIKTQRSNFADGYDVVGSSGVLSSQPGTPGVAIIAGSPVPLAFNGSGRLTTLGLYPLEFRSIHDSSIPKRCLVVGLTGRPSVPTDGNCTND